MQLQQAREHRAASIVFGLDISRRAPYSSIVGAGGETEKERSGGRQEGQISRSNFKK